MSDRLAGKIKENAGKTKYSSLNLNQTYKGTKVETKTNTGAARHGLQSLGKIGSSRRIPPPANLPSLKSENSGNDPTVSLVPSGGGGWGSAKEKTEPTQSATPPPQQNSGSVPVASVPVSQQPLLQPQRPTAPSSYPSTQPKQPTLQLQVQPPHNAQNSPNPVPVTQQEKSEAQAKTWGSVSSNEAGGPGRTYSHQPSPYFNREFPTLGDGSTGEAKPDGKEITQGPPPVYRNTHEPPWMERSGPGPPPPPDYGYGRDHSEMYNGGPGQYYRRPPPDFQHRNYPQNYPPNNYNNGNYPGPGGRPQQPAYPGPYGRPPMPRPGQRPGPGGPGPRPDEKKQDAEKDEPKTAAPATLRPEDIQAMEDDDDDGGWAGAHGEVDYSAKLNFEDFDEESREDSDKNEKKGSPISEDADKKNQRPAADNKRAPEATENKREMEGPPPQQPARPTQEGNQHPQQPRSAWGEPPTHSPYPENQRGPPGGRPMPPQMMRPYDSRGSPPGPGYGPPPAAWNMQYPPPHQRMQPGHYPPLGGPPPPGPHGRGPPLPQQRQDMAGPPPPKDDKQKEWSEQRQKQHDEMHAAIERARKRREEEEIRLQTERKAAAMAKLKALEEKRKTRDNEGKVDSRQDEEDASLWEKHTNELKDSEKKEKELIVQRAENARERKEWEHDQREKEGMPPQDQKPMAHRPDGPPRPRNDSDSSDASRSSGSRPHHNQQRAIPPRFQQQRQQQHQQYQQQQQYQASRPLHQQAQQQPREFFDAPPPLAKPQPVIDSGPVSPSHPEGAAPVRRIMKRSESSSTAGDDVASIKSLDSSGEREKERAGQTRHRQDSNRSASISEQEPVKQPETRAGEKREPSLTQKPRKEDMNDDKEDTRGRRKPEKDNRRDRPRDDNKREDYKEERQRRDRKDQRNTNEWKERAEAHEAAKQEPESRKPEAHKRKMEENDDYEEEHRHKISSRDRERQPEGQVRSRGGFPVRGRGRGVGLKGRTEYRTPGRDNRMRMKRDSRPPPREEPTKKAEDVANSVTQKPEPKREVERAPREAWKPVEKAPEKPQQKKDYKYQNERGRPDRERQEKERPEKERSERERPEKERTDREKSERERPERVRLERERTDRERSERERPERDRLEKERTDRERSDRERPEKERLERERTDRERPERERPERERPDRERPQRERPERERPERERPERQKPDKEIREKEQYDKERPEKERPAGRAERYDRKGERYQDRREENWDKEQRDSKAKPRSSDSRKPDWNKENREEKEETSRKVIPKENKEYENKEPNRDQRRDGDRNQERYRGKDRDRGRDNDRPRERERDQDNDKAKQQERPSGRDNDKGIAKQGREMTRTSSREKVSYRGTSYSTRGRGSYPGRGGRRGGMSHAGRVIGSGRFGGSSYREGARSNYREGSESSYRQQKDKDISSDDEGSETDSSSYNTASDDRSGDENEAVKPDQDEKTRDRPRGTSRAGRVLRAAASGRGMRGAGAGRGGFGRPRREQEKPPRFQKQQERAAQQRGVGRGRSRGVGRDSRDPNWSRGRGRGRGRSNYIPNSDEPGHDVVGAGVQVSEDWEEEVDSTSKTKSMEDKPDGARKETRKGGFPSRGSTDGKYSRGSRDDSGRPGPRRDTQRNNQRKGDHFLAEKQQVKADGSKTSTREPKGALPAAKTGENATSKTGGQQRQDKKGNDYSAVDIISGDIKTPKRADQTPKKANITQFDLHNIAGVICIDDFTDDDSDISSTLSGFVEVTSKRTQKELKEKQREEEERRRRNEEKASQRGADSKFKKNQVAKPPRFNKQHQTSPTPMSQPKPTATVGKFPLGVAGDGSAGLAAITLGSTPSSTNSTKRNSPVTVERALSPPPPPVFNAWNKPLTLVTPVKSPSTAMVMSASVPDPLAVGSGKPCSTRQSHTSSVLTTMQNSLINPNFDDKSAEDELKEMTKEIESMAPTEEHEETASLQPQKSRVKAAKVPDETSTKGTTKHHDGEKKQQPKPQKEKAPRFERGNKRKAAGDEEPKKDTRKEDKEGKENSSRDADTKISTEDKESSDTSTQSKQVDPATTVSTTAKGSGTAETEAVEHVTSEQNTKKLQRNDEDELKDKKDDAQPRKDSDYSIESDGRRNEDGNLFNSGTLSVDIPETSADRPPTPVSPTMYEMNRRMFAARKAWEDVPAPSVGIPTVSMPSPSAWDEAIRPPTSSSSTRVGVTSVDSDGGVADDVSTSAAEVRDMSETSVSKAEISKSTESQVLNKKPGSAEQQNVCKVKPQLQQPLNTQLSSVITSQAEERMQPELETVALAQPILTQEHILQQSMHPYPFQLEGQLIQLHQRQPQPFLQQQLQQAQAQQVAANSYQISTQMPVRQPTSAPSPLPQAAPELFQSPFLTSNMYSAGAFQGSQSFMSIPIVTTTATQSYVNATSRSQAPSVMTVQGQQPKTGTGSVFAPTPSHAQAVYMPFDPQNIGGAATLFGFNQPSEAVQRQMMGSQMSFPEPLNQQGQLPSAQQQSQAAQQYQQRPFSFQASTSQASNAQKIADQRTADYNRSQSDTSMLKHINAKPFEPPKRLSTPTSSMPGTSTGINSLTSVVNPNLVSIRPSLSHMGLSQSPPMPAYTMSSRPVSMSPVDPNLPFPSAIGSFNKQAPVGHFQVPQQQQQPIIQQFTPFQQQQVHIKPQQLQQQLRHQLQVRPQAQQQTGPQQQQGMAHIQTSVAPGMPPQALIQAVHRQLGAVGTIGAGHAGMGNSRFPGPIQRPTAPGAHGMPQVMPQGQPRPIQPPRLSRPPSVRMAHTKAPVVSTRPQVPSSAPMPQNVTSFKALQHQKMMEQTREFFNQDVQGKPQANAPKQLPSQQQQLLQEKQLQMHQHHLQMQQQMQMQQMQMQKQFQNQGQILQQPPKQQQQPQQAKQQPQQFQKQQPVQLQQQPQKQSQKLMQQDQSQLQKQQLPMAPTSGAHHQSKPPRMVAQENKSKQPTQPKQDKKEETKSHIIELPRKKPSDNVNKSKPAKIDSPKPGDDNQSSKTNGKGAVNTKRGGGPIRIAPMAQRAPPGNGRSRPNRGRPQSKPTSTTVSGTKSKDTTTTAVSTASGASSTASKPAKETVPTSSKPQAAQETSAKKAEQLKAPGPVSVN